VRVRLDEWVAEAESDAEREAAEDGCETVTPPPERELFVSKSIDDIRFLGGQLDPDSAVPVEAALQAASVADVEGERRTPAQRRADALVEVCRFYLAHHHNPPGAGRPDRLVLVSDPVTYYRAALRGAGVVTAAQLEVFLSTLPPMALVERGLFLDAFNNHSGVARTLNGNPVSDALLACVAADGILERVLTAEGRIIDHGRSIRTFTDTQRRAILARDQRCRTPGCDTGPEHCDIHHVNPWENGGTTNIDNGIAKCRHHHLTHHRQHWTDRLEPDGTYTLTNPNGTTRTTRPPGWTEPLPTLPVHTTTQPAPELPFTATIGRDRTDEHRGQTRPVAHDDPIDVGDASNESEVADEDLLVARSTINGEHWFVLAETSQELSDTITSMMTTAA
jgi:hypothetical protein